VLRCHGVIVAPALGMRTSLAIDAAGGAPKATRLGELPSGELAGEDHTVNVAGKGVSPESCAYISTPFGARGHRRVRHSVVAAFIGVTRAKSGEPAGEGHIVNVPGKGVSPEPGGQASVRPGVHGH